MGVHSMPADPLATYSPEAATSLTKGSSRGVRYSFCNSRNASAGSEGGKGSSCVGDTHGVSRGGGVERVESW